MIINYCQAPFIGSHNGTGANKGSSSRARRYSPRDFQRRPERLPNGFRDLPKYDFFSFRTLEFRLLRKLAESDLSRPAQIRSHH